jgi:hypothetical protein
MTKKHETTRTNLLIYVLDHETEITLYKENCKNYKSQFSMNLM